MKSAQSLPYILIIVLLIGYICWNKSYEFKNAFFSSTNRETSSSKKPSPQPTIKTLPKYSVSIVKTPYLNNEYGNFNFEVNVRNISITPFITKISFGGGMELDGNCIFIDNKGIEYSGTIIDDGNLGCFTFPKALLPGEEYTYKKENVGVSLDGGGGISGGDVIRNIKNTNNKDMNLIPRCHYDGKGNNVCVPVEGLKFKECTATIAIDNGSEDEFPLNFSFPQ